MNHSQFGQCVTSTDSERGSQPAELRTACAPYHSAGPSQVTFAIKLEQLEN